MTFSDKNRYERTFKQVTYKGAESAMNYIKIFHNVHALLIYEENSYPEYQLMQIFLDNFHQGGKYSTQITINQAELGKEE